MNALVRAAERADRHQPLDEHRFLDAAVGGGHDFAGLLAWPSGSDHPVAYAKVIRGDRRWELELVVDPQHRDELDDIGPTMLSAALDVVRDEGGGHVHLWVYKPTPAHDRMAAAVGLARGRDLWQLRRPLPVGEPYALETRPFVVGQGRGGVARGQQPGLRLAPRAGRLDPRGPARPRGGAVVRSRRVPAPRTGRAAGRLLLDQGARRPRPAARRDLRDRRRPGRPPAGPGSGARPRRARPPGRQAGSGSGMLYVDADNEPANRLYADLGFARRPHRPRLRRRRSRRLVGALRATATTRLPRPERCRSRR